MVSVTTSSEVTPLPSLSLSPHTPKFKIADLNYWIEGGCHDKLELCRQHEVVAGVPTAQGVGNGGLGEHLERRDAPVDGDRVEEIARGDEELLIVVPPANG